MELEIKGDIKAPTKAALQHFIDVIIKNVSPKLLSLNCSFKELESSQSDEDEPLNSKKNSVDLFMLCSDQILKCACLMADIFKREITHTEILEDSRGWVMDRIIWCLQKIEKLSTVKNTNVDKVDLTNDDIDLNAFDNDSFITWTDDTLKILEMLEKLFVTDLESSTFKNCNSETWKNECSSGILSFHKVIRQLIFSAMDICQNCLAEDQRIIGARCHVVLRESKNLIEEILDNPNFAMGESENIDIESIKIKDKLHYPTVKMFIDILKEAVYCLETSINRGVLSIVLKCMMDPVEPLDNLVKLYSNLKSSRNGIDICPDDKIEDAEKSLFIKEFDIHSEQIIQIGLFAISCSSDKQRVLQLKSCLASLEIIEIHLIPTILSNPTDLHTQFMIDHWIDEIKLLRNSVYLIVDPVAFIDLVVEKSRENTKALKKMDSIDIDSTKYLIKLGRCVLDYFNAYFKWEPHVVEKYANLKSLINDLNKVVNECQTVVDLFLSTQAVNNNSVNKQRKSQDVRIVKRFKLLHSLLIKISSEFSEENHTFEFDSESFAQQTFSENMPSVKNKNTYYVSKKVEIPAPKNKGIFKMFDMFKGFTKTDVCKDNVDGNVVSNVKKNLTNKTFSRSTIVRPAKKMQRSSKPDFESNSFKPILKRLKDINDTIVEKSLHDVFSASGIFNFLDEEYILANVSVFDNLDGTNSNIVLSNNVNKSETSRSRPNTFYKKSSRRKHGASLRRKVLINRANIMHNMTNDEITPLETKVEPLLKSRSIESLNNSLDLHITDILEKITTLSDTISLLKIDYTPDKKSVSNTKSDNVLTLKINETPKKNRNIFNQVISCNKTEVTPKKVWNIKVSDDKENMTPVKSNVNDTDDKLHTPNVDCEIDVSFGSNIPTPERMNDLNLLEKKLNELKQFWEK